MPTSFSSVRILSQLVFSELNANAYAALTQAASDSAEEFNPPPPRDQFFHNDFAQSSVDSFGNSIDARSQVFYTKFH